MKNGSPKQDEVMLLFSGGVDSTMEAVGRAEQHRRVHLLTFNNGCCLNLNAAAQSARLLVEEYGPERVVHEQLFTYTAIKPLLSRLPRLLGKYRSPLILDMFCKVGSIAAVVDYGLSRGVFLFSDGASREQTEVFIQHPVFRRHIKPCVEEFGIRYLEPLHNEMSRREKYGRLRRLGFTAGHAWLEKFGRSSRFLQQPFCLVGISTYFFTSPTRHLPFVKPFNLTLEQANRLWDELWPEVRTRLREGSGTNS